MIVLNSLNGIHIRQDSADYYHGSFEDIQVINNTIADNGNYGLTAIINDYDTSTSTENQDGDGATSPYYFNKLVLANNIYSDNFDELNEGAQVRIVDDLVSSSHERGFLKQILSISDGSIRNNCYYSSRTPDNLIQYENSDGAIVGTPSSTFVDYSDPSQLVTASESGSAYSGSLGTSIEEGSVLTTSNPCNTSTTNYKTYSSSSAENLSSSIGPDYYAIPTPVPEAQDYLGVATIDSIPDTGAFEVG